MSNKTLITQNTVELQEILATINNLPEAGEGGGELIVEPLSVTENGTYTPLEGVDGFNIVTVNVPQEGGSGGSGIIDVTELPTSGIDEGAVYRLTETIQTSATQVFIKKSENIFSVVEALSSMGVPTVPNLYVVDELPADMKPTDVSAFSEINGYILRTDGKCYMYATEYGMVLTAGYMFFQDPSYDNGSTDNVYRETENGVYTTLEAFKEVVRYFIRENSEWKEITTYIENTTHPECVNIDVLSGDVTDKVYSAVDIISGEYTELDESWFIKRNGTVVTLILPYRFRAADLETVVIPDFIKHISNGAFSYNYHLKEVTFKGTPNDINGDAFYACSNLTTINVPWAEGEVTTAPWGATNATINYNYTEG